RHVRRVLRVLPVLEYARFTPGALVHGETLHGCKCIRYEVGEVQDADLGAPLWLRGQARFSRSTFGCRAAILNSAKAGPSGVRRPCSQFRKVWMLIPKALANACWLSATKRRSATMSSPDSILPAVILRRRLARIPRLKSLSLSSRALFINLASRMFGTAVLPVSSPTSR